LDKLVAEEEETLQRGLDLTFSLAYFIPGATSLIKLLQGKQQEAAYAAAFDVAFLFAGAVAGKIAKSAKDAPLYALAKSEATADIALGAGNVRGGLQSVVQAQHLAQSADPAALKLLGGTEIQVAERSVVAAAAGTETESAVRSAITAAHTGATRTPTAVGAPATAAARPVFPGASIADDQTAAVLRAIEEGNQAPRPAFPMTAEETYAGVREASQYLKDTGVPRAIRKQVLESFDVRTIQVRLQPRYVSVVAAH
jgi:hypothetical protein